MLNEALGLQRSRVIALTGAGGKTSLMFALAQEFLARGERVLLTTTANIGRTEGERLWPSFAASDVDQVVEGTRRLREEVPPAASGVVVYATKTPDWKKVIGLSADLVDALSRSPEFDRILVEADCAAQRPLKAPNADEPVIPASTDALVIVSGLAGVGLPLRPETVFRPERFSVLSGLDRGAIVTPESLVNVVVHPEGLGNGCPPRAHRVLFLNRADTPAWKATAKKIIGLLEAPGQISLRGHRPVRPNCVVSGHVMPLPGVVDVVRLRT